jgi:holin-like protein
MEVSETRARAHFLSGGDLIDLQLEWRMTAVLGAFLILISCELLGEFLRAALHLPVPGAVVGMILLAAGVALRDCKKTPAETAPETSSLDRTAGTLLDHMGLLFVPAGVGIIAQASLLREEWKPIVIAVVGSTVLSLLVTGFVMHRLVGVREKDAAKATSRKVEARAAIDTCSGAMS